MNHSKFCFSSLIYILLLISLASCDIPSELKDVSNSDGSLSTDTTVQQNATQKRSHFIIGTGGVEGLYYPIAGVICRLLNRHQDSHNVRCSVESTGGSVSNLKELRKGNFDIVVAQSDWQYHAYKGSSAFEKDGPNPDLRSIFSLEADPLALIVRKDSQIDSFEALKDKTVSLGYTRSLQHRIISKLLQVKGWNEKEVFSSVARMNDSKQVAALCDASVDAALFLASSLNDYLKNIPQDCELKFVPLDSSDVDKAIAETPYFRKGVITQGQFLGSTEDIPSFGLGATFVTLESTSPKAVYYVTKEIFENFKDFQSLHPSLLSLNKRDLPYAGNTAPLHAGAERYYKEARLLKR